MGRPANEGDILAEPGNCRGAGMVFRLPPSLRHAGLHQLWRSVAGTDGCEWAIHRAAEPHCRPTCPARARDDRDTLLYALERVSRAGGSRPTSADHVGLRAPSPARGSAERPPAPPPGVWEAGARRTGW